MDFTKGAYGIMVSMIVGGRRDLPKKQCFKERTEYEAVLQKTEKGDAPAV